MISPEQLQKAILQTIETQAVQIAEEEIKKAQAIVRDRIAAQVGSIATTVASRFSYEFHGTELAITVRFK